MRINKFVALATGMSRRAADSAIASGEVNIDGRAPQSGEQVADTSIVSYQGKRLELPKQLVTILFNKPIHYVCSRNGQGSKTVYELLPDNLQGLKTVGRLDKESSGLLLLTNDGDLAQQLTHPRYAKVKKYEVRLDKPLAPLHQQMISELGIQLEDGISKLFLERLRDEDARSWLVIMSEGRNRQIRRTFAALGYTTTRLHRTQFGSYRLGDLAPGKYQVI